MLKKNNTNLTIQQIKDEIEKLKGKKISMSVNQGRKKFVNYEGIIQDTYKSIFVVKLINEIKNIPNTKIERHNLETNIFKEKLESQLEEKTDYCERKNNKLNNFEPLKKIENSCIENQMHMTELRTYSYIDILCGNVDIYDFNFEL